MRNVVLWAGMTLDGFTSGEKKRLDWLVPHATQPEAQQAFRRLREVAWQKARLARREAAEEVAAPKHADHAST